jgi:hypothetical protein
MPLPNISPELLKAYQEEIAKRTSPATAKRKTSSLRRFFSWAHKEGHIDENPLVQPSGSTITQPPEKPKPSFFRFSNILRFAGLAGLVVLIFLLAKRVQISIPWRLAPATEEELAQQVPQPTPIPQEFDTKVIIAEIREEILKSIGDFSINWASFEDGNLLIGGDEVSEMALSTADTSDGDITINPDGAGIAHFLFEGTSSNFLNAQAPNLIDGSLYYGIVANNATEYDLIKLQSGSKPITRFSVDALGNTYIGQDLNVEGDISTDDTTRLTAEGELENITGYTQTEGNFSITQTAGESAMITKKTSALSDLMVLTLDEREKPENPNSIYSTLVLNRYDGSREAMALLVDEGNAQFDGQIRLGRFATNPDPIGTGSFVYNSSDGNVYVWSGSSWVSVGGSGTTVWTKSAGVIYPATQTDDVAVGGTDSTAPFFVNDSGTISFSTDTNLYRSSANTLATDDSLVVGGNLDVNGSSNDIAGTLNLSGNTLSSSADLTIDPTGGGVKIGTGTPGTIDLAGDDLYVTQDLEVDGIIYGDGSGITGISASSMPFSGITTGTNTTATMTVDTGASLTYSGTGTINASSLESLTASQFLRSDTSDSFSSGTLTLDGGTTLDVNGDFSVADTNIAFDGATTTFTTTGDLTINSGGGDLIFSDAVTINIGGSASDVAYNVIGDSTTGASGNVDSDDDLYIEGNLEVDGTIYGNVSGTINPGFTTGSVIFQGASGLAQDNPNFFWDDTDNKLGIGTSAPTSKLHIKTSASSLLGKSALIVDQLEAEDILTASASGTTKMILTNAGELQVADLTLGLDDATATISTKDTDENITIDPNGVGDIYFHGSTYQLSDTGDLTIGGRITFENAGYIQNEVNGILYINEPTVQIVASTALDIDSPTISLTTQATNVDLIDTNTGALTFETNLLRLDTSNTSVEVTGTTNLGDGGTTNYASFNSTGDLTFVGTGDTITGPGAGGLTLTNTSGQIQLITVTDGEIDITAAGLVDINAGANLDVDITGTYDLLASSTFSIDGTGNSNVTATSGDLTLSTATAGDVYIGPPTSLATTDDLYLQDGTLAAAIPLTDADTALQTPTAAIIDAINEAYNAAIGGVGSVWTRDSGTGTVYPTTLGDRVGIGTTTPANIISKLFVTGNSTLTGKAVAIFDQTEDEDILTASASGTKKMVLTNAGNLEIEGSISDITETALTINDDLKVGGDDIQDSSGNVIFSFDGAGNIDSLATIATTITQSGNNQVTFTGNVDATNGLDVTTADLTVGGANFTVAQSTGNITTAGDVAVNGGDITTTQATFNLINTTATTLKIGEAATSISLGAGTGTTTINNATTVITGNLDVNGATSDIAGTLNLSGDTLTSSGDLTINPGGGEVFLSDTDTLIIGGHAGTVDYNVIANTGEAPDEGAIYSRYSRCL